ncbi:MAG: tyrosine-type recombinase/integrase [Egibacteraceae bacterium]
MRRGSVFRRCGACGETISTEQRRRCPHCGSDAVSWTFVVDVAPPGAPRRRQKKGGFPTKRAALSGLNDVVSSLAEGGHVAASKVTVSEYLDEWLCSVRSGLRPGSFDASSSHVNAYIKPRIGAVRLQALSRRAVKAFYGELAMSGRMRGNGGLSDKTIHNVHRTLSKALDAAVEDGLLTRNPARGTHKLPESPEQETWTAEDLATFLTSVTDDRWYAMWRLAAFTGLRRGELAGLRWRDVDLDAGRLFVVQQRAKGGGTVNTGRLKGKRGRSVTLDPKTVETLRQHRTAQLEAKEFLGQAYQDEGLVFCHENGKPLHPDSVTKRFARLVRDADMPVITFHGLRHTHATVLLRALVHPKVVQERLGHSSIQVTLDVYSHAVPALQGDAAIRFAEIVDQANGNDEQIDDTEDQP